MRPLADDAHRRLAATDFSTNLVVSAAAGTGKTSLLVERILNAVGSGRWQIPQLAAVTFTRKAAAEMRARLSLALERLHALARAGAAPETPRSGDEAMRAYAWLRGEAGARDADIAARSLEALGALDCLTLCTLHSFCADLLRLHPLEAGVDPRFAEDDGARFDAVFEREWAAFLEEELGAGARRAALWEAAIEAFPVDEMKRLARALCEFRLPPAAEWKARCADPAAALAGLLGEIVAGVASLPLSDPRFNPSFVAYARSASELARAFIERRWAAGEPPPAATDAAALRRKPPGVGARIERGDPDLAAAAEELAESAHRRFESMVDLNEEAVEAILEPLRPLVGRVREAYLRAGWLSFDGMVGLARDLLRDHPAVRRDLRERFRHLLVDEFQDTSPIQYEILFWLAEGPGGAGGRARLEPGRLFIVGDPKQSIYRFLKADLSAYREAVERILGDGGAELSLSTNFRSRPSMLAALNQLFQQEFPERWTAYQPGYQPMCAPEGAGEEGGEPIEIWSTAPSPWPGADERREAEAAAIAGWLRENAGPGRLFEFRKVAVLVRAATDLATYLQALRDTGLPFVVEGGKAFLERAEVRHLRALMLAVARPHDPVALLAALRSPAGGASDADLLQHARAGGAWSFLEEPPPASAEPVRRALLRLRRLAQAVRALPADEQAAVLLERTRLDLAQASHADGAQRLANVWRYARAVAEAARQRGLALERAIAEVDARAGSEAAAVEESPLADETLDAVRVLTVHRAKGMEFDAVIVPDLLRGRPPARAEAEPVVQPRSREAGLAVRVSRGANVWRLLHDEEESRHERAETLRTLYVACTRARRRLVLVGGPGRGAAASQCWPRALRRWGYDVGSVPRGDVGLAGGVRHRLKSGAAPADLARPPDADLGEQVRRFGAAFEAARAQERERERTPSGLVEHEWERGEAAQGPAPGAAAPAVVVGSVVHETLETWDGAADAREALAAACARRALQAGVEAAAVERDAALIWSAVLRSPLPALLRQAEVRGRELPLLMQDEQGRVWRGSIDLLYRERDGAWIVADYKTDDPGGDPDAYARRYLPQLRVYARAVERALGCRPRAEVFWLRTGARTVFSAQDLEGSLA